MTRVFVCAVAAMTAMVSSACGQRSPAGSDLIVRWQLVPSAPVAGRELAAEVTVEQPGGEPVRSARLQLEGHMTHPGMAPVITPLTEADAGRYRARLTLTMGGSWVMVVRGQLSDGRAVHQRVADVVAAAEAE